MPKSNNRPTMADVAREAGVALGTVSKVVNNQSVGEEYRQKVEHAIARLGYRYNTGARALRTSQTGTVALIVPSLHPFFAMLAQHVNIALSKRNYRMLLFITEEDYSKEIECIQLAAENRVDGIIALTYNPSLEIPKDIRFVTVDRFFSKDIPCVASDNFEGGRIAAYKLHELGCKKPVMLFSCSPLRNEPSKRKDGFVSACEELGLPYSVKEIEEIQAISPISCYEPLVDYLREHFHDGRLDFDGIFCSSDTLANHIRRALKGMGLRIPEDVQIIGYDGIREFSNGKYVVSTIVQPIQEMAETCVSTIVSEDFSSRPSLICLPVEFADGGTTKKTP